MLAPWKESCDKPKQHIKKQRHHFADKDYGFSSSHVRMGELDHKEGWVPKNWCFWTPVLEKTFKSPLVSREIKPVNPKGNQSWIFIGKTDAEAPTWCDGLIHWKRHQCWERLRAGGEGDDRGWDGWMASPTQWTPVWASSGSWWWTAKPGELQSMGLQRVRHDQETELNTDFSLVCYYNLTYCYSYFRIKFLWISILR